MKASAEGDAVARWGAYRVLCALRRGPSGAEEVNRQIEARVKCGLQVAAEAEYYDGRPIIVLRNDPEAGLFNGDVGVVRRSDAGGDDGVFVAHFPERDGIRVLSMARVPVHESVYAMTIHKSQGSEFDEVQIVLPTRHSPILTRELLYTGVTRARSKVVIRAAPEIVKLAVGQRVDRASGLAERLGW